MVETPKTASFAEFAVLRRCKRSYVTDLRNQGRLVLAPDGRILVAESIALIESTRDDSKQGVADRHAAARAASGAAAADLAMDDASQAAPGDGEGLESPSPTDLVGASYQKSRAESARYAAMEAKRAYEVAIGKLLDRDEVVSAVAAAVTMLRSRLEAHADNLAPQLAPITDEADIRARMWEAIERELNECARQFSKLAGAQT